MQTIQPSPTGASDLLSQAFALTVKTSGTWIGAQRTNGNAGIATPASGWTWVDGTPASNLNCLTAGCLAWIYPQVLALSPSGGHIHEALSRLGLGLDDCFCTLVVLYSVTCVTTD